MTISVAPVRDYASGDPTGSVAIGGAMIVRSVMRYPNTDTGSVEIDLEHSRELFGKLGEVLKEIETALGTQDGPGE